MTICGIVLTFLIGIVYAAFLLLVAWAVTEQ